jgi:hypothetical protein
MTKLKESRDTAVVRLPRSLHTLSLLPGNRVQPASHVHRKDSLASLPLSPSARPPAADLLSVQSGKPIGPKERKIALLGARSVGPCVPIRRSLCPSNQRPSVGKSSLVVQFVDSHFVDSYYPTIENTFQKTVKVKGNDFSLEIHDTAGHVSLLCPMSLLAHCGQRRVLRPDPGCH